MPSMPLKLWGDSDGTRLRSSYFAEFPGIWRHGDWVKITSRSSAIVYGRSDATLNRGGVRMGTAELYRIVEAVEGVADSLAVDTSELGRDGELLLFVVPDGVVARRRARRPHQGRAAPRALAPSRPGPDHRGRVPSPHPERQADRSPDPADPAGGDAVRGRFARCALGSGFTRPTPAGDRPGRAALRCLCGHAWRNWRRRRGALSSSCGRFSGSTFTYAGLQKLTNRFFFNAANPGSIQVQLHASIATSPIGPVLRLAARLSGRGGTAHRLRRACRRPRDTRRALRARCRRRRDGAVAHLVPVRQLQHDAVLPGLGHRLLVRLDAARDRRLGSVVRRRRTLRASRRRSSPGQEGGRAGGA